jgi:MFS family permease
LLETRPDGDTGYVRPSSLDDPFLRATVTNFFFCLSLNAFVLLPLYVQRLGGTAIEVGIVMGLYSAVGILCQPLLGPWVDAVGRRPFMVLGPALAIVAALLASMAGSIGLLGLVRTLQGLAFSAFFVASFSYVIDLVPPARRGWALGIYGVAGMMATAIAPMGGEWISRRFGFPSLFLVSAVLAGAAGVFVLSVRETRPPGTLPVIGEEWLRGSLADVLHLHMGVTVFFGLGAGTIFAFLPTFADGLGVHTLSLFYTAYSGSAMVIRIFGGRLIDTEGRRAVIVPSMYVQAAATAILASLGLFVSAASPVPVLPFLFLAGLLSGGAHGFLYPGLAALVVDRTPEVRRATVVGIFSAMFLVGQTSGAFVFGYVAHAIGYGLMWTILTTVLLVGALASDRLQGDHETVAGEDKLEKPALRRSRARGPEPPDHLTAENSTTED